MHVILPTYDASLSGTSLLSCTGSEKINALFANVQGTETHHTKKKNTTIVEQGGCPNLTNHRRRQSFIPGASRHTAIPLRPLLSIVFSLLRVGIYLGTQLATPAPEAGNPRQGHGAFDTFRFVTELEGAGVPREQAIAMMEQVLLAISEANTRQIALVRGTRG